MCETCGRGFFVKGEYTCHCLSGKPLAFQCTECGKHFSSQQVVDVHVGSAHTKDGERQTWACPLCEDTVYSSQVGWYKHLRKQHGIMTYGKKLEEAIIEEAAKKTTRWPE